MARDSLFDEEIIWSGGPKTATVPLAYKVGAIASAVVSLVSLAFAVVVARGLGQTGGTLLLFSGWCAALALAAWRLPLWFRASARYLVTDRHVIWQRGRLRRSIDRDAISYAVIRWSGTPGVGDLVLERAVPTGALRRTLSLTLPDVEAPDRLWALVRGLTPSAPQGDSSRSLAQRLDDGERVLWSAFPRSTPWTRRRTLGVAMAFLAAASAVLVLVRSTPAVLRVVRAHALSPFTSGALVAGVGLGVLLLVAVAATIGYVALVRPVRLARETRYFVTDRRVLIRRGAEELHLDRDRIAYVISTPSGEDDSRRDLFLVLDGPQARAFSPSGAFGEPDAEERLRPVFTAIEDADTATELLHVSRISLTPAQQAA